MEIKTPEICVALSYFYKRLDRKITVNRKS